MAAKSTKPRWKTYEQQVFEEFKLHFPEAKVTKNMHITGHFSKRKRQIDILRMHRELSSPFTFDAQGLQMRDVPAIEQCGRLGPWIRERPGEDHRYAVLTEHPRFMGVDVDTNARGTDGRISAQRVDAITHAWRADG